MWTGGILYLDYAGNDRVCRLTYLRFSSHQHICQDTDAFSMPDAHILVCYSIANHIHTEHNTLGTVSEALHCGSAVAC